MYNQLTITDLDRMNKQTIKEEIKMSILSMGISLGGFSVNFSIDKAKKRVSVAEIRNQIEHDIMIDKVNNERNDMIAKMHLGNGLFTW